MSIDDSVTILEIAGYAIEFVAELGEGLYSVYERHWADRDKRRFYVRELVKKGRKRS